MKVRKLGLEWGPAYTVAFPVEITHGDAHVVAFISEKNELVIQTKGAVWKVQSSGNGSDCELVLQA